MTELLPLRVYMSADGHYGIIHIYNSGADVIATKLSHHQAITAIQQAMEMYPNERVTNSFDIKANIDSILKAVN
tara:strand:+ start:32092 stop:32313 length:222 start_codon:yes stop_codon:yes gene_type:complete